MVEGRRALSLGSVLKPELSIFVVLVLSLAAGVMLSPNFLDLRFILRSTSLYAELGIIALAFTYLLIAGEIDVSVASAMTLTACIMARMYESGIPMNLVLPCGAAIGLMLGLFNGILVTVTKLPSLIITLGTMSLYKGLAQVLVGDKGIGGFPPWFVGIDNRLLFGLIPFPLFIFMILALLMEIVLKNTFFGRKIFAIGSSKDVARYSAVKVDKMKVVLFGLVGLFCAFASMLSVSRLQVAKYTIGTGGELDVITMVLLGGTAFSGGRGSILATMLAFFAIVFVRTGMLLAILSSYVQVAVIGSLLILVMIVSDRVAKYSSEHS